jgi:hypothetical protein
MSRALFVDLDESKVVAMCRAENVGISAIERLASGGVRVVCMSSHGAFAMGKKFKGHIIAENAAVRARRRPVSPLW